MEPTITCRDLLLRLGDDEILVLDCRSPDDIAPDVQIPGALRISLEELAYAAHCLPDDELIVICSLARDGRSWRACRMLRLRGLDAVVLEGGLRTWISLGFPTEHGPGRPLSVIPSAL